ALVRAKGRGEAMALLAADPAIREGVFTGVVRRCHALFNGPEDMGATLSQVRSNKRAVRALFEAVDRRDGEGVRAGYDENITIHGRSPAPPVIIPCSAALRRMLDAMDRTSPLILTTKTGQSFKKRYFARLWDETATAAGLESITLPALDQPVRLHFHDLRGTTVTLLSESGSNPQQIATITGHSLKTVHRILERYLARTSGLAEQAIFNWENSPRTEFANALTALKGGKRGS